MIINSTTETIEIILAGAVATTQATFMCSYNEITATSLTPYQNNGTTNGATAVTLVPSPGASAQRQLRELLLTNNDTAAIKATIRFNNTSVTRSVFIATLQTGESLAYDMENGWVSYDLAGQKEVEGTFVAGGGLKLPELTTLPNITSTSAMASTNIIAIYLGKAEKAYTSITVAYRVATTALSAATWAELAIYRVAQPMGIGTQQQHMRLGFTDTTGIWNTLGQKYTAVTLTGCKKGDDLYAVFGQVATTGALLRSANIADPLSSIHRLINTTGGNTWRPSTTEQYVATAFSNSIAGVIIAWQGT